MNRIYSVTEQNSNKQKCGITRGLPRGTGCDSGDCHSTSTISWDLVSLVMVCLPWSTLLEGGGTSTFTKMSTLSSSSWLQEMLVAYSVQWTLCKQFRPEGKKKNSNIVIKCSSGHRTFSVFDLRCWSGYRSLFTVTLPKAVLKNLCSVFHSVV